MICVYSAEFVTKTAAYRNLLCIDGGFIKTAGVVSFPTDTPAIVICKTRHFVLLSKVL